MRVRDHLSRSVRVVRTTERGLEDRSHPMRPRNMGCSVVAWKSLLAISLFRVRTGELE